MDPGTPEAVAILTLALEHSGRLGHRYIGGEHLLLALVSSGQPAGALLSERGVTPRRVEEEIVRLAGHGAGAGLAHGPLAPPPRGGQGTDPLRAATGLWRHEDRAPVHRRCAAILDRCRQAG
jgi:ATP-dependent Clp protease ATP-binding subunit ClpA